MSDKGLGADAAEGVTARSAEAAGQLAHAAPLELTRVSPGPWRAVGRVVSGVLDYAVEDANGEEILALYTCDGGDEPVAFPVDANAHLIAAAPEMKEALKSLRNEISGLLDIAREELRPIIGNTNVRCLSNRIAEADAALAKAEGR